MRNNETVVNGYLAANGFVRVYANRTQAAKAAARLCYAGYNAFSVQDCQSMRFIVRVA